MKAGHDLKSAPVLYNIGQRIWVYTQKTQKGLSKKLLHRWLGPYRIVQRLSPVTFQLRNSANRLVAAPVLVNCIKPFYDANDRPVEPPSEAIDQDFTLKEDEIPEDSFQTTSDSPAHNRQDGTPEIDVTPHDESNLTIQVSIKLSEF